MSYDGAAGSRREEQVYSSIKFNRKIYFLYLALQYWGISNLYKWKSYFSVSLREHTISIVIMEHIIIRAVIFF